MGCYIWYSEEGPGRDTKIVSKGLVQLGVRRAGSSRIVSDTQNSFWLSTFIVELDFAPVVVVVGSWRIFDYLTRCVIDLVTNEPPMHARLVSSSAETQRS